MQSWVLVFPNPHHTLLQVNPGQSWAQVLFQRQSIFIFLWRLCVSTGVESSVWGTGKTDFSHHLFFQFLCLNLDLGFWDLKNPGFDTLPWGFSTSQSGCFNEGATVNQKAAPNNIVQHIKIHQSRAGCTFYHSHLLLHFKYLTFYKA